MPGSYSQLLLHIVFSTKHRKAWITGDVAERLYPSIGGIVRAEKGGAPQERGSQIRTSPNPAGAWR